MELSGPIEGLLAPTIEDLGFAIVRVRMLGERQTKLQVMVEHHDGKPTGVDDCADISRAISAVLDVAEPIAGAYTLEVSSPGIDRPLVRRQDFDRFAGHEAKVKTRRPIDGRKRFRGRIIGIAGDVVQVLVEGAVVDLPYDDIAQAKLVFTEDLLAPSEDR